MDSRIVDKLTAKEMDKFPGNNCIFRRDRYFNAAVLIPFLWVNGQWNLLFQKRAKNIRQGGEISFPGGGYEKEDETFQITAVRETVEELGIGANEIQIFGKLGTYIGRSGMLIEPYLGEITLSDLDEFSPDEREVEKLIMIPLSFFLDNDPQIYHIKVEQHPHYTNNEGEVVTLLPAEELGLPGKYHTSWGGNLHEIYVYKYKSEVIWGITADLIVDIVKRLKS